jgi:mono/diheme cytochrome c family protein
MKKAGLTALVIIVMLSIIGCKDSVSTEKMEAGKKVYDTNCMGCHMDNGMGVPRMNPKLVNSPYVMGNANGLIELVLKGSEFFGNADRNYNNLMASFSRLTDDQIADVITYIRNKYANTGDEISADDVKNVRAKLK